MRKTHIAAAAAGVVLMTGLTACGSDDGGSSADKSGDKSASKGGGSPVQGALAALQKASTATEKQQSAKTETQQTQVLNGRTLKTENKGAFDWSSGGIRGTVTATMKGGTGAPMDFEVRYLADGMYIKTGGAGGGAKWAKSSYDELGNGGPSGAMLKDQLQNNNPARSVQTLLASRKVEAVGSETVRGTKTTHYTGTLTLSELVKMQSKDLKESDRKALERQFEQAGMKSEKIDLWIDGDDLLIKKKESSQGSKTSMNNVTYYSDYGTDVDLTPPPASQVEESKGKARPGLG